MLKTLFALLLILPSVVIAKEIALTFDDAPVNSSAHFGTHRRTSTLINKLKLLKISPVLVFANACNRLNTAEVIAQLEKYKSAGHLIGNHTCSHLRLDDVGFEAYSKDAAKGDELLTPFFSGQKFFRFPYLNESDDEKLRDQMRDWLKNNRYRNGMVSIDNDDYLFSFKINQAKHEGKKIDYKKIRKLFLSHILGAVDFYDDLAVKTIGYSPKHVLLLHEMDATVMFIDSLVKELRAHGWKIIGAEEAYQDNLYFKNPKNTYTNNGIIAQLAAENTGEKTGYFKSDELKTKLDKILGLLHANTGR